MPVEGVSKLTRVQLAQLSIDLTKGAPVIQVTIAMIDPVSGAVAFLKHNGSIWSDDAQAALRVFVDAVETAVAKVTLSDYESIERTNPVQRQAPITGLGEHLTGSGADDGDIPDV